MCSRKNDKDFRLNNTRGKKVLCLTLLVLGHTRPRAQTAWFPFPFIFPLVFDVKETRKMQYLLSVT